MIKFENIEKIYAKGTDHEVKALNNINLEIKKGEIFGVIGLSGAGKSTLVRMINLLERPTAGVITVDGVNLMELSESDLREQRRSMGMIFQSFNLLSSITVEENVAFPLRLNRRLNEPQVKEKVASLLEMVGLGDKAKVYPAQLSGGQKQRVGIARALANDPHILLCDEATSSLDPQTTISILDLLMELKEKLDLTIVLITHQMEVIKRCCDRVAVIDGGTILEQGTTIDLFTNPKSHFTRNLVASAARQTITDLLAPRRLTKTYTEGSQAVVELMFLGEDANDPVIVEVAIKCKVKISIMAGIIDYISHRTLGLLVVEISGPEDMIDYAVRELRERVYKIRVLGYENV